MYACCTPAAGRWLRRRDGPRLLRCPQQHLCRHQQHLSRHQQHLSRTRSKQAQRRRMRGTGPAGKQAHVWLTGARVCWSSRLVFCRECFSTLVCPQDCNFTHAPKTRHLTCGQCPVWTCQAEHRRNCRCADSCGFKVVGQTWLWRALDALRPCICLSVEPGRFCFCAHTFHVVLYTHVTAVTSTSTACAEAEQYAAQRSTYNQSDTSVDRRRVTVQNCGRMFLLHGGGGGSIDSSIIIISSLTAMPLAATCGSYCNHP